MNRSAKRLLSRLIPSGILLAAWAAPAGAASGDTVADRVLGQRRLSTSIPYFVDGRVFGAVYGVTDVAVDRSVTPNRVYLADTDLNRVLGWSDIRQFRAGASADLVLGQPSLFTGQLIDSAQGCPQPPSATSFCRPTRVEVDPAGNLYVADSFNYRVLEFDRPFTTDRTADLVFGQPDFTSRGPEGFGSGVSVFEYGPELAVDAAGNLWIADPGGSRRIFGFDTPPVRGTVADRIIEPRPFSQCGTAQTTPFCYPAAIGISPAGDLYVRNSESGPTHVGSLLIYRQPLTTDLQPDLVVTYPTPLRDMVFDPAGDLLYFYGSYSYRIPAATGPGTIPENVRQVDGYFDDARIAMDSQGNFYVASSSNRGFVAIFDGPNQEERPRVGRAHLTNQGLRRPVALAVDRSSTPNHLYVLDQSQRLLGWRDAEGFANGAPADLVLADRNPCNVGHLCLGSFAIFTNNLAVDSKGNLWVSSTGSNFQILEFDRPFETDLVPDRRLGKVGCAPATRSAQTLCYPGALAFDRDDNLYVADLGSHRVLLFKDPLHDGTADKVFGQADFRQGSCNRGDRLHARAVGLCFGYEDGYPNVRFYGAGGVAVDAQGNLYVADSLNFRVLIYKDAARSDTVPDAVLGQDGSFRTRLTGTGAKRFGGVTHDSFSAFGATGLAVGPGGELYVADASNDRLLVFKDPLRDDVADRVFGHSSFDAAGSTGLAEFGNNPPPTAARLLRPMALGFDAQGNLYVADTFYNRVLAFDRP